MSGTLRGWLVPGVLFLVLLAWGAWRVSTPSDPREVRAVLSPAGVLAGDDTTGYARAEAPRDFRFPHDHAPHPEYRTEWWYLTGHLDPVDGDRDDPGYAFQLTFFRAALAPSAPERSSAWNTNQLWMAHFGLTDVAARSHRGWERLARGAAGLAGATGWPVDGDADDPLEIRVEDWWMRGGTDGTFPRRVGAREGDHAIHLALGTGKPAVLQGDAGLSRKGAEPGNASYYVSLTRIPVRGTIVVGGRSREVRGEAWMDREWSTSALSEHHVGWDWFSVQMSDGRELMFFELRSEEGAPDPFDHGALVHPDGSWEVLRSGEARVTVLGRWTSPLDGAHYPSGWRLELPAHGIDLELVPLVRDQEMNLSFRYWEGAVRVAGTGVEGPVTGRGFVELTGYGATEAPGTVAGDGRRGGGGS